MSGGMRQCEVCADPGSDPLDLEVIHRTHRAHRTHLQRVLFGDLCLVPEGYQVAQST